MNDYYLKILSASAGSGKTYNLVQEFLKLTIKNEQSTAFTSIVAMTFTNKASLEMKERIIDALDILSYSNQPNENAKKKRDTFLLQTANNLGLSPEIVESKAKRVLKEILHQYEDFSVLTIDKFSLRLIRTFARDLDHSEDFNVVMDEGFLIEQVVDIMLSNIGREEHKELTTLALQYAKSNLEEGDKWDFRNNLISFASLLTKEANQDYIEKILALEYTKENYRNLKLELNRIETEYDALKKETKKKFNSFGITDLPGKSKGLTGEMDKIENRNFDKKPAMYKATAETLTGKNLKDIHFFPSEAKKLVEHFFKTEIELYELYYVTKAVRKNFYNLALLKYVAKQLNEVKKNENIIRISEFNKLISNLISEENTLYIYEKLGNRFQHYLLDEFQDTSRLQWLNLIPLIDEAISRGKENLIVGDPKQAIYRFRNGLVEQFMALPSIYEAELEPERLRQFNANLTRSGYKESLEDNWRSNKNIVTFNNLFFPAFSTHLSEDKREAYADVKQNLRGADGGYIEIQLVEEKLTKEEKYNFEHLRLLEWIRSCEAEGFKRGDICILARNKKDGSRWAQFLTKQKDNFKIVSADSLVIKADKTIQLFIDYLNLRRNYANVNKQIQFAVSYFTQQNLDPLIYLKEYWIDDKVGKLNMEKFVVDFFKNKKSLIFNYDNLYDLGQRFSRIFKVNEIENPYLHHLMEMLQNFDQTDGPDIRAFLEFWNQKGSDETVQVPKNKDAIQIMTIHQSKGLEFPVVILPNLDWDLGKMNEQFIENKTGNLLYLTPTKSGPDFILKAREFEESQKLMDEINLLYVAMTRPVQRLYLISKKGNAKSSSLDQLFSSTIEDINHDKLKLNRKEELSIFTFGVKEKNKEENKEKENTYIPKSIHDLLWFPEISLRDKDALESEDLSREQRFGNQLHLILSETDFLKNLKKVISQLKQKDTLEKDMLEELETTANRILNNTEYQALLENASEILSEQDIIIDRQQVKRPDKLLINQDDITLLDFKTGEAKQKDIAQLRDYAFALKEIGYKNVNGILFYTKKNRLERVF